MSEPPEEQPFSPRARPVEPIIGVIRQELSFHAGPIPSAQELSHYEDVAPGAADRILRLREREVELTERQVLHRQQLETTVISHDIRSSAVGQWMAFTLVLADIGSAVYLGIQGHDWLAGAFVTTGIGAVTAAFLKTASDRRKERVEKTKLLTTLTESSSDERQ